MKSEKEKTAGHYRSGTHCGTTGPGPAALRGYIRFCFPLPEKRAERDTAVRSCSWFCFRLPDRLDTAAAGREEATGTESVGTEEEGTEPAGEKPAGTEPAGTESTGTEAGGGELAGIKSDEKEERENYRLPRNPGGALREGWQIRDDIAEPEKLRSITFLDFIAPEADGKWDVSEGRDGSVMAWLDKTESGGEEVWDLYIGAEGGIWAAADSSSLFQGCGETEKISFHGNLNTSRVTDMSWMFAYCDSLTALDVSGFDTSRVTNMGWMFAYCDSLKSLDVSGFDTSQVTGMSHMFCGCGSLSGLDVSGFHTSRVMDMSYMFDGCSSLEELDLSGFDMSKASVRKDMLRGTKTRWPQKRK